MMLYHNAAVILKTRRKRALPRHGIAKRTDACFESRLTAHESSRQERKTNNFHQAAGTRRRPVIFLTLSLPRYNWNCLSRRQVRNKFPQAFLHFRKRATSIRRPLSLSILISMLILELLHPVSSPLSNPLLSNRFPHVPALLCPFHT
jgi:hypothetical protein